ncbi:cyclic di-AMP binding protein CbpA [Alteribacter aurantiacus]|uniref:cyclic di-AMP binding protein CbpA n=1 Tax=Alteribacter aurantiacus TaxID=254410 RepID=UPI000407292F|nr:cyclic di-AMP binding protein CbpA [Alteribacter aurantiacus]
MQIKSHYLQKRNVKTVDETMNVKETLDFIQKTGFRCVPVLSGDGKYLGNIYKTHLYEHLYRDSLDPNEPVTSLLSDKDKAINEKASFFSVFFTIRQVPYLAVIGEDNEFKGILTHGKILDILENAWAVGHSSYAITLSLEEYKGSLHDIVTTLTKVTDIRSFITLDSDRTFMRRCVVTLPSETTEQELEKIVRHIENNHFRVIHIENEKSYAAESK